jgi:hypothetical protein
MGAVSPAGWNVAALRLALEQRTPLPIQLLQRPGWEKSLRARLVPQPLSRPAFLAHPRLRRASPITHYAASAALEAAAPLRINQEGVRKWGVIVCLQSGCIQYSCRFFGEALQDPATASPLLFPETVYGAPASHVAALLENVCLVFTLLGDPSAFLQGVALGVQWLEEDRVDACIIIGAEENHWLLADALWHLEHSAVISNGAGALCLCREPKLSAGLELAAITEAHPYSARQNRRQAAQTMRGQLGAGAALELLCDGLGDSPRADAPEAAAWRDWTGPRLSPKRILGEGLMASASWQCVAACDALATGRCATATVSLVGANQQALGARFAHVNSASPVLPPVTPTGSIPS